LNFDYNANDQIGQLNILKKIVETFGKEQAAIDDSRKTQPVFFAAQQGKSSCGI